MDMFQITALGIIAAIMVTIIRSWKPELAIPVAATSGIVILISISGQLKYLINAINDISIKTGITSANVAILLKITGVAYLTEFASGICRDSGESSIAGKIELAGRTSILYLALPIALTLLQTITSMFNAV